MKARYIFPLILIILLSAVSIAQAQEDGSDENVGPLVDYFKIDAEVSVPSSGARDVVVFGPVVDINNPVEQDVLAAGGTVIIQSDVGGDVRAAGSRIIIDATISGNVALLAQNVEIKPGSIIKGSIRIQAQKVIIDGSIAGDAHITAQSLEQNGSIGGELVHDAISAPSQRKSPLAWFFRIASLFGMLVVGLVLVSFAPNMMRRAVNKSIKNPTRDILVGIIALILTPIVVLVLMFTIIGIPLGVILGLGLLLALYLAKIMVGIVLGTYLFGAFRGRERAQKASLFVTMVLGVLVLWLIIGIPSIGGLLKFIAMIWGLGMLVNLKINMFKKLEA